MKMKGISQTTVEVLETLQDQGCQVIEMSSISHRVFININFPSVSMQHRAIEVRQRKNGIVTTIYTISLGEHVINWSDSDQNQSCTY